MDYSAVILDEANHGGLPVGYWPFSTANGSVAVDLMAEARGVGNNGTLTAGVTPDATGPISRERSRSLTFNGSSGSINMGSGSALAVSGTLTLEVWLNTSGNAELDGRVMLRRDSGSPNLGYDITVITASGAVEFYTSGSAGHHFAQSLGSVKDGRWHHVVVTHADATQAKQFYIDGTLDSTVTAPVGHVLGAGATSLLFGRFGGDAIRWFNGKMAHAAIYNYVLPAHRIRYHYLAGINGSPRNLLRCA